LRVEGIQIGGNRSAHEEVLSRLPLEAGQSLLFSEPRGMRSRWAEPGDEIRQIGCGCACRPQVFVAYQLYFAGDYQRFARRADSHLHSRAPDMCDDNLNLVANEDSLTLPARHH
jgi:hypothetical protein